ncbi:MAG: ATP-binding protein, partial [Myxococcota bacterium]
NGILDLSKVEAGQLELFHEPCDLERLLDEVIAIVRTRADEKGLLLQMQCDLGGQPWRSLDPVRLKQVLLNLLINAAKFTEAGSVRLSVQSAGSTVTFEVIDTGIGMTDEQVHMVFEPFHQAERSTTRRFGGTGLGLTVSRQLIALWQGTLSVRSSPGVGTTMRVELKLPIEAPQDPQIDGVRGSLPFTRALHVLVAEDHPVNQLIIRRMLEIRGHHVTMTSNGQEAVDAGTGGFDIVFMDIQMPVMDGLEAARRIRALEAENHEPAIVIVALTANAMRKDQRAVIDAGMSAHMAKPVDEAVLDDLLSQVAQRLAA